MLGFLSFGDWFEGSALWSWSVSGCLSCGCDSWGSSQWRFSLPRGRIERTQGRDYREASGENVGSGYGFKNEGRLYRQLSICRLLLNRRARRADLLWRTKYTSVKFSQRDKLKQENMDRQTDLVFERLKKENWPARKHTVTCQKRRRGNINPN